MKDALDIRGNVSMRTGRTIDESTPATIAPKPSMHAEAAKEFQAALERIAVRLASDSARKSTPTSQAARDAAQRSQRRRSGWLDLSNPKDDTSANHKMARLVSMLGMERVKVTTSKRREGFTEYVNGRVVRPPVKKVR